MLMPKFGEMMMAVTSTVATAAVSATMGRMMARDAPCPYIARGCTECLWPPESFPP